MPRLRPAFRALDPGRSIARVPVVPRRRPAEAAIGVRGRGGRRAEGVREAGVWPLRHLRRPARSGQLFDELIYRILVYSALSGRAPNALSASSTIEASRPTQ